jgi:hypothetical protein
MKKLKIAVCFSGQLRDFSDQNVERMRHMLPDADFFCTAWNDSRREQRSYINKYYDPPKLHYFPHYQQVRKTIQVYKVMEENGWHNKSLLPPTKRKLPIEKIKTEIRNQIFNRAKGKYHMYQVLAHAHTVQDFVSNDYDIVIRSRYDASMHTKFKSCIYDWCQEVYDTYTPMGFHFYNKNGLDNICDPDPLIVVNKAHDMSDYVIIHRRDMFDPNYVFLEFERKRLPGAESGWWWALAKPYNVPNKRIYNVAKLDQQLINDRQQINEFVDSWEDPNVNNKLFVRPTELMQTASSDIADYITGEHKPIVDVHDLRALENMQAKEILE